MHAPDQPPYVSDVQILLVEDDRDLRRFLSKAFREEGYGVTETDSGDRALERALEGRFSCVVLDVMLPGRDGFSVVAELRKRPGESVVAGEVVAVIESREVAEAKSEYLAARLTHDLQRTLATDIARRINVFVKPVDRVPVVKPEAYGLYLKGLYAFHQYTNRGWQQAIEHFKEAIANDQNFAPAYAGLADSYIVAGAYGWARRVRAPLERTRRSLEEDAAWARDRLH